MYHQFDVSVATLFGVDVSAFLTNIAFWTRFNVANQKHFHDGNYWTYNTYKAFSILFPYWSEKQVRTIIGACVKNELLIEGNYNKAKFDRTKWYALTPKSLDLFSINIEQELTETPIPERAGSICPNGQMDVTDRANGYAQTGRPIPDVNTDSKPDTTTTGDQKLINHNTPEPVVVSCSSSNPNPKNRELERQLLDIYRMHSFYTNEILGEEDFLSAALWSIENRGDMALNRRIAGIKKLVELGKFEGEQEWINENIRLKNKAKGEAKAKAVEEQMRYNGAKELNIKITDPLKHKDMLKELATTLKEEAKKQEVSHAEKYKYKKHDFRPYAFPEDFQSQSNDDNVDEQDEAL